MISIIIPTLNEESVLKNTILSLRKLNVCEYEIIVSDGKSIDRTVDIAKEYADRVIIYDDAPRQTISMGRNLGASIAKGEYLVFIDADVAIPDVNNFFTKALSLFEEQPKLAGLTVFIKVFRTMRTPSDRIFFGIVNFTNYFFNNYFNSGKAIGEFQMIPANAFKKVNGYNEKIVVGEDMDMFSRLSKIGKVYTDSSLSVYHTSRRAHNVGWPLLLFFCLKNIFYLRVFGHSATKEWKPIR